MSRVLSGVGYPRVARRELRVGGFIVTARQNQKKILEVGGYVETEIQSWQIGSTLSLSHALYFWEHWPNRLVIPGSM